VRAKLLQVPKRLFVAPGAPPNVSGTLFLPKGRLAGFASDALSSVAYAPQEIFACCPWPASASITTAPGSPVPSPDDDHGRRLLPPERARLPSGGGDYEVATTNSRGQRRIIVASALIATTC